MYASEKDGPATYEMRDQIPPTAQPVTANHTSAEEETTTAPQ